MEDKLRECFEDMVVYKDLKKVISSPRLNCRHFSGTGS